MEKRSHNCHKAMQTIGLAEGREGERTSDMFAPVFLSDEAP
jgi:hypothetical protein